MGDSLFEFEESDISENENISNSTEGNIGPSPSTSVSLPGAAKQIFDGYRPIAPISMDVRDSGEDSDRDTGSETFWDQVEDMRGIMLMEKNRDDFDFSKKEVTTFNEKARKRIKSLGPNIQHHSLVAYLDDQCWQLVETIARRMRHGQFNGRNRQPTTTTFRFLQGCKTHDAKKKLLQEFLRKNAAPGFGCTKKRAVKPKVNDTSIAIVSQVQKIKILEQRLQDLEKENFNLKEVIREVRRDVEDKDLEITRLNGIVRRNEGEIAHMEYLVGSQKGKMRELQRDRDSRVSLLEKQTKKWKDLYMREVAFEEYMTRTAESSGSFTDNSLNFTETASSSIRTSTPAPNIKRGAEKRKDDADKTSPVLKKSFEVKQDATSKFLAKLMVSKQNVKDEESDEDSDDFEGASVSSGDAQNTPEQLLDGKEKLKPKEKGEKEDGMFVAVAYSGGKFYVGKILSSFEENENDEFEVDFMKWTTGKNRELYWPSTKDVSMVSEKFIYVDDVQIHKSSDREGRFCCQPDFIEIKRRYDIYKDLHGLV